VLAVARRLHYPSSNAAAQSVLERVLAALRSWRVCVPHAADRTWTLLQVLEGLGPRMLEPDLSDSGTQYALQASLNDEMVQGEGGSGPMRTVEWAMHGGEGVSSEEEQGAHGDAGSAESAYGHDKGRMGASGGKDHKGPSMDDWLDSFIDAELGALKRRQGNKG